jgi:deoxyhypusine monooxygenase
LHGRQSDAVVVAAASAAAALQDASALLRHEVAFCMGQRQDPLAIQQLKDILNDPREHAM